METGYKLGLKRDHWASSGSRDSKTSDMVRSAAAISEPAIILCLLWFFLIQIVGEMLFRKIQRSVQLEKLV